MPKHKGGKRVTIRIVIVLVLLVVIGEIGALLWLQGSVARYQKFWENKAQETGEITYVALGDSAAQGIGASSPMRGYVGLITKSLEQKTDKKVRVINLSVSGATARDCLDKQIPELKNYKPDLVTIEIGANDVKGHDLQKFESDFSELLPLLPKNTYVSNMPLFNSRPSSTQGAKEQSKIIERLVSKNKNLNFVDLQTQTTQHQSIFGFAPDLFHPNNLSYKNWADAFWNEIEKNKIF